MDTSGEENPSGMSPQVLHGNVAIKLRKPFSTIVLLEPPTSSAESRVSRVPAPVMKHVLFNIVN